MQNIRGNNKKVGNKPSQVSTCHQCTQFTSSMIYKEQSIKENLQKFQKEGHGSQLKEQKHSFDHCDEPRRKKNELRDDAMKQ